MYCHVSGIREKILFYLMQFLLVQSQLEFDLVGLDVGFIEGGETSLEVLGIGVQPLPQVVYVWGSDFLHLLGSLCEVILDSLGHGSDSLLEVFQVLVNLLLQVVGVGPQVSLQLLHTLLQLSLQLLAFLDDGGPQGLSIQTLGVGGQLLLELLHSLSDLDLQVLSVGLQLLPGVVQVGVQAISQIFCLLGDSGDQFLGSGWELLLQGDCILAGCFSAVGETGTEQSDRRQ